MRALSRLFRRLYLTALQKAFDEGELALHGSLASLQEPSTFARWIGAVRAKEWVVYAKPPFGGPVQVLKYLARYTHRVAISNSRLVSIDGDHVRFLWKDRAQSNKPRCMRVTGVEFVRRFLLHVLPKGFVRIRHFGFLSNRSRQKKLALARRLIADQVGHPDDTVPETTRAHVAVEPSREPDDRCPSCEAGHMKPIGGVEPQRVDAPDTS